MFPRSNLPESAAEKSRKLLARFNSGTDAVDRAAFEGVFAEISGRVTAIDHTDGLRATFANEEIIHLRPSGNAPEFRCYSEAATEERTQAMNARVLEILRALGGEQPADRR